MLYAFFNRSIYLKSFGRGLVMNVSVVPLHGTFYSRVHFIRLGFFHFAWKKPWILLGSQIEGTDVCLGALSLALFCLGELGVIEAVGALREGLGKKIIDFDWQRG